jgi:hypothetical protein
VLGAGGRISVGRRILSLVSLQALALFRATAKNCQTRNCTHWGPERTLGTNLRRVYLGCTDQMWSGTCKNLNLGVLTACLRACLSCFGDGNEKTDSEGPPRGLQKT